MSRHTALGVALTTVLAAVTVASIRYGQSLTYIVCLTAVAIVTAAVWWVWVWRKMNEQNADPARQHRRFLR